MKPKRYQYDYQYNYLGMPVEHGLSVASMTLCEQMHLTANGCDPDNYDPDCEECPYNPKEQVNE
jgi:hypothetical protein